MRVTVFRRGTQVAHVFGAAPDLDIDIRYDIDSYTIYYDHDIHALKIMRGSDEKSVRLKDVFR